MVTLRRLFAIYAIEDLELAHFDIRNTFTETSLDASLSLRISEGVDVKSRNVLKVLRSLYGLKQAARDRN